jgi:hypothetical protein
MPARTNHSTTVLAVLAQDTVFQHQYQTLISLPEYSWLIDGPAWWTIKMVAEGMGVSPKTIWLACQRSEIAHARCHGGKAGWRIPFSSLVPWLYALHERKG